MKHYLSLIIAVTLLASCENEYEEDTSQRLVIEAFLYENQPVDSIQVKTMIALGSDEEDNTISDADVTIRTSDGNTYTLLPAETEGYYYSEQMTVSRGITYELEVNYAGQTVNAQTSLPEMPTGLSLSSDTLYITQVTDPSELGRAFFVQVDNIVDEGDIVDIEFPGGGSPRGRFQLVTQPTEASSYVLDTRSMEDYGVYRVVLFALNQEYVDLYETSGEDSRSFSEPLTNITNGLGIFTSFSSDTTYLTITQP